MRRRRGLLEAMAVKGGGCEEVGESGFDTYQPQVSLLHFAWPRHPGCAMCATHTLPKI